MRHSIFDKYLTNYLDSRIIFLLDVLLSTVASAIVSIWAKYLAGVSFTWIFVLKYCALAFCATILAEFITKEYRTTIRHMGLLDVFHLLITSFIKASVVCIVFVCMRLWSLMHMYFIFTDFLLTVFFVVGYRSLLMLLYRSYTQSSEYDSKKENILIYGAKTKAASLVTRLSNSTAYKVCGLISPTPEENGKYLCEKTIYYFDTYKDFLNFATSHSISAILFAHESEARKEADGLVSFCYKNGIKVLVAPSVDEVKEGMAMQGKVRELKIEDLLGRDEINLDMDGIRKDFKDKVILVTGAAGSIGSELVRQLAGFGVRKVVLFDNAETPMHNLRLELEESFPNLDFVPVIGDVRVLPRLDCVFRKHHPQIVFHAAAYKHVPLMEENPCEAVLVNVAGSRNVADKCIEYGVEKMVMISTDKAVNPTNVMGCTKRLAEIYVQSLGLAEEKGIVAGHTKFVTTRFGNVLGSNGSVIPRFREQIEKGGPVTVTHPEINRFFMTIPEACRLVMEAAILPETNRIFVFDMGNPVKIDTLARRMIVLAGLRPDVDIKIIYTGLRPGEKLYEEVLASAENTDPTSHERIKIAHVREYDYEEARKSNHELEAMARSCSDIPAMVRLMKSIVPEFISKNSVFEGLDK